MYRVWPTGTVFHHENRNLVGSLSVPLIFGQPVVVSERYIHIFIPRRIQEWTRHWTGRLGRSAPRLRRITVDTFRQRKVVGDGIFAPRGRVVYTAGPRVDYRRLFEEHLTALIAGSVNDWGDPQVFWINSYRLYYISYRSALSIFPAV